MMVRSFVEGRVCTIQQSWCHMRSRLVTAPCNVIVRVCVPFDANLRQQLICLLPATSSVWPACRNPGSTLVLNAD